MSFEFLKPTERRRVMDLLVESGVSTTDWKNFKGGESKAASNPRYCYEWSYEDHDKRLIVLNLWYRNLEFVDGKIMQRLNLRKTADAVHSSPQRRRAIKMDFFLQKAVREKLRVRVIICDGEFRDESLGLKKSSAERRLLDDEVWHVQNYDSATGDCTLTRGPGAPKYIDQFELAELEKAGPLRKEVVTNTYERSAQVRTFVLERAQGQCEWCGAKGFITPAGSVYLETHHIQPLATGGADEVKNMIGLCPNDHRQAHYGADWEHLKHRLLERANELNKSMQPTAKAAAD